MRSPSSSLLASTPTSFLRSLPVQRLAWPPCRERRFASAASPPSPPNASSFPIQALPFRFETGIALFAKRSPRPFPPPFLSPPSASFSDPLSTHHRSRDRRAFVNGHHIRGLTNGDDAVYASDYFICANDGVGAWATRPRGHAGLWARLVLHFWSTAVDEEVARYLSTEQPCEPNPIANLQAAYEQTLNATEAHDCLGTTTTCGAQLHFKISPDDESRQNPSPLLYVTNIGDCKVLVLRPKAEEVIYRTTEQWHWFDCPRQLGTNSPDTPNNIAVMDKVDLEVGDIVLAMSDGVTDNLWEHEIVTSVINSVREWESSPDAGEHENRSGGRNGGMDAAARDLVAAAKKIAQDPFAESPFMEHAIEEGLASEHAPISPPKGGLTASEVVAGGRKAVAPAPQQPPQQDSHPLKNTWIVWYRAPGNKFQDYEKSTLKIAYFGTVEEFWSVYTHLRRPSALPHVSDYHLFKKGIRPVWEDKENRKGGKWNIRLKKGVSTRYWEDLVLAIVGDQFGEAGEDLCGAVLSIRGNEDVLSVWTRVDGSSCLKIKETIKRKLNLPQGTRIDWKSHASSLEAVINKTGPATGGVTNGGGSGAGTGAPTSQ